MGFEIVAFLNVFKERIASVVDQQIDEVSQLLDKGFNIYTNNWWEKINKVKTFLFYENPVCFDKIYMPLSVKYSDTSRRFLVDNPLNTLFKNTNYITVLGHAGSGKTMLMKHCFLSCIKTGEMIPMIIELRKLNEYGGSIEDYITNVIFKFDLVKNKKILTRLLFEGEFIFFLDGYDEISLDLKERRTAEIEEFVDRYNKNLFLLTSRPGANAEIMSRFTTYHMCELSDDEIKVFVNTHTSLMSDDEGECKSIADKMLSSIFSEKNSAFKDYLKNPLLLSMFMLTFRMNPEIPSRRSDFYFNVFETLFVKHDVKSKSGGYIHDRKCHLEKEDYQNILKWFSYISYFQYRYVFDDRYLDEVFQRIRKRLSLEYSTNDLVYDLTVSISILLIDGLDYNFPHRSMQEYFAAYLISSLPEELKRNNIYGDKLLKVRRTSDFNFWSLCEEMDDYCFKTYFILPLLKEIRELFSKKYSGYTMRLAILLNFVRVFNLAVKTDGKRILSVRYSNNKYSSILRYTKIIDPFSLVFDCFGPDTCLAIKENIANSNDSFYELDNAKALKSVFKGSKMERQLYLEYKKMCDYIDDLEMALKNTKSMDVDLLNLV